MEQSKKRQDLIKVAKLYYYGNMSQENIASTMNLSRPKISRLLSEARTLNIVQIKIKDGDNGFAEYAEKIQNHFNIEKVIIAPSGTSDEQTKQNLGLYASSYLNSMLDDNMKIGISWGTTLRYFTKQFKAEKSISNGKVVQLVGGTYSESLDIDGRELVKELAMKLNCDHSILQAPLIVHNPKLRDLLMEEPDVIAHFKLIDQLDMAFVGIGSAYYKDSIAYKAKYISEKEGQELNKIGVVCDICSQQLLLDGTCPQTFLSSRIVGTSIPQLDKIPNVVGIACGNKKTLPIISALNGKHVNTLIIDDIAAISILETINIH